MAKFVPLYTEEEVRAAALANALTVMIGPDMVESAYNTIRASRDMLAAGRMPPIYRIKHGDYGVLVEDEEGT